jgi:hypothetical protein
MNQYREDEIRAIVQECEARRTYATAHCHPASAIRRCVEFGITRIEHGSLIDAETARFVAERGAYVTPTLVTAVALMETGRELGMPAESLRKCEFITEGMWAGLEHMRAAGVKAGLRHGPDGQAPCTAVPRVPLRSRVFTPLEILRQATSVAAEALMMAGEIGCIAPGACADLILVDGDPLQDIGLLAAGRRALAPDRPGWGDRQASAVMLSGGKERTIDVEQMPPGTDTKKPVTRDGLLQNSGGLGRNRTTDTRIFKIEPLQTTSVQPSKLSCRECASSG